MKTAFMRCLPLHLCFCHILIFIHPCPCQFTIFTPTKEQGKMTEVLSLEGESTSFRTSANSHYQFSSLLILGDENSVVAGGVFFFFILLGSLCFTVFVKSLSHQSAMSRCCSSSILTCQSTAQHL